MAINYEADSELLKALGHPVRLRIAKGLLGRECSVNKIVNALGLPQSTVSQHLGVLKNSGVALIRKEGVKICYRVADKRVIKLIRLLDLKVKK